MSRLTGPELRNQIAAGVIQVDPYVPERVQAASIDLTLGPEVRAYAAGVFEPSKYAGEFFVPSKYRDLKPWVIPMAMSQPLDCRGDNEMLTYRMKPGERMLLVPEVLYLMHTHERLHTLEYEIDITGKSSLARRGIIVHHTAAHIDPGFDGQVTLEVAVAHMVYVYEGMEICQARVHTLEGEIEDYRAKGHYTGAAALGAQPPWRPGAARGPQLAEQPAGKPVRQNLTITRSIHIQDMLHLSPNGQPRLSICGVATDFDTEIEPTTWGKGNYNWCAECSRIGAVDL